MCHELGRTRVWQCSCSRLDVPPDKTIIAYHVWLLCSVDEVCFPLKHDIFWRESLFVQILWTAAYSMEVCFCPNYFRISIVQIVSFQLYFTYGKTLFDKQVVLDGVSFDTNMCQCLFNVEGRPIPHCGVWWWHNNVGFCVRKKGECWMMYNIETDGKKSFKPIEEKVEWILLVVLWCGDHSDIQWQQNNRWRVSS